MLSALKDSLLTYTHTYMRTKNTLIGLSVASLSLLLILGIGASLHAKDSPPAQVVGYQKNYRLDLTQLKQAVAQQAQISRLIDTIQNDMSLNKQAAENQGWTFDGSGQLLKAAQRFQ